MGPPGWLFTWPWPKWAQGKSCYEPPRGIPSEGSDEGLVCLGAPRKAWGARSLGRSAVKMILGIDPGTRKCGYAVLTRLGEPPAQIGIVETGSLAGTVAELLRTYAVEAIALGSGTHAPPVAAELAHHGVPVHVVDEYETTLRARARYFIDHPPRGWKRWVPRGMLLPPVPIDDYAALLIAERFLAAATPLP
jgi:RNase H-fold protein (predicted Holliday junction resolvase)